MVRSLRLYEGQQASKSLAEKLIMIIQKRFLKKNSNGKATQAAEQRIDVISRLAKQTR